MTDPLREAVNALTKPVIEHIPQTDDDGKYLRTHTVEHPALLVQLAEAVTSSLGSPSAGRGSDKWSASPLNSAALFEAGKILAEIGSWCERVGVRAKRNMHADLIAWSEVFEKTGLEPDFSISRMKAWAGLIRNLLEPPKSIELRVPCPVCKNEWWVNSDGDPIRYPLQYTYRVDDIEGTTRVKCRECAVEWESLEAVQELAEELQEAG